MCNHAKLPLSMVLLFLGASWTSPAIAQAGNSADRDFEGMLRERDAAIISLQNKVNQLLVRLNAVEQSLDLKSGDSEQIPESDYAGREQIVENNNPTRLIVDEVSAERALERTLMQAGALLLPRRTIEFVPTLSHSASTIDFPIMGPSMEFGHGRQDRAISNFDVTARIGLPFDSQLELGIPYIWADENLSVSMTGLPSSVSEQSGQGVGDFRIGLAKTLFREHGVRPDLVARVVWGSGSGDEMDGSVQLGGGFESLGGSLTFVKRRDPLVFFGSISLQGVGEENGVDPGNQRSFSIGAALAASPESSVFGSITRRSIDEFKIGGQEIPGSDLDITTLGIGVSTVLGRGTLINIFSEIGVSEDAPDYTVGFSMSKQKRW